MDKMTKEQRHRTMASIRSKDTKPELIVRKFLWNRGFRYRLNNPRLPGHPDIVLKKYRTCVFSMVVFGMVMRIAPIIQYQKPTLLFGGTKLNVINNATSESKKVLPKWAGIALLYGNVN